MATQHSILGELDVPLGLGLLRLTTAGRPSDIDAVALIRFALNQGIRILDTAGVYCLGEDDLHYGEQLIRQALRNWNGPKDDVRVLTKAGLSRPGGKWIPNGRPDALRSSVEGSLAALGVERLFLLQLHARDPGVPLEESLAALAELQQEGLIEHLGLCNVTAAEIAQAQRHFTVATLQNELSVLNRKSAADGTLAFAAANGILFLAARPLGGLDRAAKLVEDPILAGLGQRHGATAHELAIAALLQTGAVPLIGATRMASVRSSLRACGLALDASDQMALALRYSFDPSPGAMAVAAGGDSVGLPAAWPCSPPASDPAAIPKSCC